MDFGEAIRIVKDGGKVRRTGWNGLGMWIALSPGCDGLAAERIWSTPIREYAQRRDGTADFGPYLMMLTAQGGFVPWTASHTDLLYEDWITAS